MVKKCNVLGVQMLVIWNISSRLLWFAEMHFGYLNTSSVFKYLEKSFKKVHLSYNSCYGIRMWITVTVIKSFRIPGLMIQIKSFQLIFIRHWNESKFKKNHKTLSMIQFFAIECHLKAFVASHCHTKKNSAAHQSIIIEPQWYWKWLWVPIVREVGRLFGIWWHLTNMLTMGSIMREYFC